MFRPFQDVAKIANNVDALHCAQITMIAALETMGVAELSMKEAEEATGFRPGVETWPFAMLRWLGENGLEVVYYDATDLDNLILDPAGELSKMGAGQPLVEYLMQITDFTREAAEINAMRKLANVRVVSRLPEISDIRQGLNDGWLALISLDAAKLKDKNPGRFDQHLVLASGVGPGVFELQDSGPPARFNLAVEDERLLQALRSPLESAGTVILARPWRKSE